MHAKVPSTQRSTRHTPTSIGRQVLVVQCCSIEHRTCSSVTALFKVQRPLAHAGAHAGLLLLCCGCSLASPPHCQQQCILSALLGVFTVLVLCFLNNNEVENNKPLRSLPSLGLHSAQAQPSGVTNDETVSIIKDFHPPWFWAKMLS